MDIIYSRKKLSIKKKYLIILLLLLLVIIFGSLIRKIAYPTFENLCKNRAIALAAKILNDETDITMKDYSYEDLVKVEKDNEGNVQLIDINIFVLNDIISHITENTQDEILKNRREELEIRLGALLGSKLFAGIGPKIEIKIDTVSNFSNSLKSEFYSVGINQSIHRIYLELSCEMSIITPINNIEETVRNQVLLVESIIVGETPDSYYEIESLKENEQIKIIR